MTRPSPPEVLAETARLAYHLHWPLDSILDLEHRDRRLFLAEADALAGLMGGEYVVEEEPPPPSSDEAAWAYEG
ncbi:MAG TPA: hypothetical protein VH418_07430 [Solirubrobacteraceae bacterium]